MEVLDMINERLLSIEKKLDSVIDERTTFTERCRDRHDGVNDEIGKIKGEINLVNQRQNILNVIGSTVAAAVGGLVGWFK